MSFHSCGRGGVWDLTSHITCLASQCGETAHHAPEEFDLCFNNMERLVQEFLPPKIHHDALGFILKHLTPVAHERAEMPHDKQDELHQRLLKCGIRVQGPLDAVMLNEIECDISTPSGEHWVGRNMYKWFPGNEEVDIKTTCSGTITTYSKLGTIAQQGYQSDVFDVVFANADECDMDEESLRRLLCLSGTLDGARGLINQDAWDLAIYLYTVTDRKQYQGLGMECTAAPTVCACVFGRDCTLNRTGTILAAEEKYNRDVAQVRAENPDSWEAVPPHVSTDKTTLKHTCVCGKISASVYALKNHIAEGWVGSSHDRSPECRPRLRIAYIISDASHPNPYLSLQPTLCE